MLPPPESFSDSVLSTLHTSLLRFDILNTFQPLLLHPELLESRPCILLNFVYEMNSAPDECLA